METCVFCPNPRTIHCEECQAFSCSSCAITQHLPATKQSHIMQHLCEECEEEIAEKFCENCDQNLCPACDTKIHNKGKRAKHAKKVVSEPLSLDKIQNLAFVTAPFFQECLNSGLNSENLRTKIAELAKDIDHNSPQKEEEGQQQHRLTVLLLEQDPESKDESTLSVFSQVLEELKLLKNIIPVQENKKEASFLTTKAKVKENPTQRRAAVVSSFLKGLDMVDAVFIYDVNPSNEQLAELLNEVPTLKQKRQIFLSNMDFETQPISSSPFSRPRRSSSITKNQEEFTLTEAAFKNEATFPSDEVTSSEIIFSTPISGLLTPESSFSSFEIPTKSSIRGTHNAFVLNSKENIHPNLSSTMSFGGLYSDPEDYGGFSSQMLSTFESKKALVPEFQPLKNIEIRGSRKFGDSLQEEIKVFANKGELLIPKETLLTRIKESFQLRSLNEAENILSEAEAKKIVHITIRKFPNYNPYCYVGLLLNVLTLESLTWVIKSIKCDLMTPTEKLILSRIKECYGLKIDPVFWKVILNTINSLNNSPNNNRGNNNNCPLYVKQILDPVTNLETNALYLNNDDWEPEDQGVVDETTMEWKAVLAFIEDFFKETPTYQEKKEKERFTNPHNVLKELPQGGSRWNNSVENILNRSANENEQRAYKVNDDVKAIPGGRYGCAQFIKYCGPENLKDLSIGKLSLLVQEAINKGILRYQRTLLVKNAMNDNSSLSGLSSQSDFHNEVMHSLNAERKAKLISMVKEALLEILMENPRGISLAQIPFHLKKKLKFNVDFQELGFPKLKNFLTTLKNLVIIESVGTNHTCVKLKEPLQGGFGGGKGNFHKKRIGDIDKAGLRMSQYTRSDQTLNMRNYENDQQQIMRPDSELIRLITEKIRGIVTAWRQGIAIGDLYRELCNQLKVGDISFIPFGCENFYQFLLRYEEQIVDISVKKNGFIVYPKSQDFWVKGKEPFVWQTPGKTLRSPPGFYEGHSGQHQQQQQILDPRQLTMDQKFKSQPNYGGYKPSAYTFPMETPTPHYSAQSQSQGSYGGSRGVGNTAENPNFLNISPIIYSGNDANEGHFPDNNRASGVKYTNVNVSTWNLNYNYGQDSGEQQQNPMLWQFNPQPVPKRQVQAFPVPGFQQQQEESQLELQNNLRFIEELLQNDEEKGVMSGYMERSTEASLGGFNMTPSQGFSGKPFPKNRS